MKQCASATRCRRSGRWRLSTPGSCSSCSRCKPPIGGDAASLRAAAGRGAAEAGRAPMRVAIFSDVHANLPALRSVLDDIDRRRVDARACLGDSVGYGAEPRECLDLLFESCTSLLAGNHDLAAAGQLADSRFSGLARHAVEFARRELTPAQRERLGRLPNEELFGELLLVHASPADPAEFPYVRDAASAREQFDARAFRVALYGHTHLPLVFEDDGERVALSMKPTVQL